MKATVGDAPPARQLLTPDDIAEILGVSRDYVIKTLVYQRRIEFVKIGGHVRFTPEAVQRFIDASTIEAAS